MKRYLLILLVGAPLLTSCDFIAQVEDKARTINNYERTALHLAKENRLLKKEIGDHQYEIQSLKSRVSFLSLKLSETKRGSRGIASVKRKISPFQKDLVKFNTYKWTPSQLLSVAEKEFSLKHYDKSAQHFHAFINNYPGHEKSTDEVLFKAGISAYESSKYFKLSSDLLGSLMEKYPTSKYYRGAKLWNALAKLKMGEEDIFFDTVEEFRKKYRNTTEWKIISRHYHDIVQKYKKN